MGYVEAVVLYPHFDAELRPFRGFKELYIFQEVARPRYR